MKHACPDLVAEAVYGLPEVNRAAIKGARLIANPGCYPTAVQLGFLPLLEAGVVDTGSLIADAKSGVSGAGRKAETHILFAEASDNFKAYGVSGHRHLPEIAQGLDACCRQAGRSDLRAASDADDSRHSCDALRAASDQTSICRRCSRSAMPTKPFVDVLPAGSASGNALGARREYLPHCRAPAAGRRYRGGAVGDRQSGQGRGGPGGAEHEHPVRTARGYGLADVGMLP